MNIQYVHYFEMSFEDDKINTLIIDIINIRYAWQFIF